MGSSGSLTLVFETHSGLLQWECAAHPTRADHDVAVVQVLGSQDSPASSVRNPRAATNGTNVLNLSGRGQCPERA